eukprot:4416538-Prymnesium_polylepis.2
MLSRRAARTRACSASSKMTQPAVSMGIDLMSSGPAAAGRVAGKARSRVTQMSWGRAAATHSERGCDSSPQSRTRSLAPSLRSHPLERIPHGSVASDGP